MVPPCPKRKPRWLALCVAFVLVSAGLTWSAAAAQGTPLGTAPERRVVIALSDATPEEHRDTEDPISLLVELPLQHLGLVVRRWPVAAGAPPAAWLDEARGVLTWFGTRASEPGVGAWVRPWLLEEVVPRGLRVVLLGEPGLLERTDDGRVDTRLWAGLLAALGLEESGAWCADPLLVDVVHLGVERCAVEAPVLVPVHRGVRTEAFAACRGRAWVTTRVPHDSRAAAPVVTGAFGGLALNPFVLSIGSDLGDRRWHLELFAFLREAFALEGLPVFDPCVLNGRRRFFVQVDGDGFESYSTVERGEYAARVLLDEVIERFALPFTVSIVVASVTDALDGSGDSGRMDLAREILTRPNVEVASHGVLHPLKWSVPLGPDTPPRTVVWYPSLAGYTYSGRNEVLDSTAFIDRLLSGTGRHTEVMLWTGDAIPAADVLNAARMLGLANVNGGTYRWDSSADSVGYVRPLVRLEGDELQVFCGGPNENVYDGFFDRHPGAFRHLATSLERTGAPRILKPANIYMHFYAAERPERLRSAQALVQRFGVDEPTAPVFASEWFGAAHDAFTSARLTRLAEPENARAGVTAERVQSAAHAPRRFQAAGYGRCRTLRFDDEARDVDFAASPGVLGAKRIGAALYVHLAREMQGTATVVTLALEPVPRPHLAEANHVAEDARRSERGIVWRATSCAPRMARVAGFEPGVALAVTVGGALMDVRADVRGEYTLVLPPGDDEVEVGRR